MAKKKTKEVKPLGKRVSAFAKCASFDIDIQANFIPSDALDAGDVEDIRRKLKQKIAQAVASLPFAHIYPFEVRLR